jgi:threonine dehydrogenase-like Zn-dependent dehydrogenase
MKALFIREPGRTEIREIPRPTPGRGDARLRVKYVGFCGSDLSTFRGLNPLVSYPRIPGHEVSGVIESVGPDVSTDLAPGTAVLVVPYTQCGECSACRQGRANACQRNQTLGVQRDGALTEEIVVSAEKLVASSGLDLRAMALVEPLAVGWHASARGRVAAGDTVAVFGCGMVGLGAVAGASAQGARVIAIDVADEKLELARAMGAVETIRTDVESARERLQSLTGGWGPDVLVEAVGLPETFRACVEEAAFAGRVVYVGYAKKVVEYETKLFVQKELDILGSRNATPDDFMSVLGWLKRGSLPLDKVITRTVSFAEAGDALAMWDRGAASVTRIMVRI